MSASHKTHFSETDICDQFITPALQRVGWTIQQHILREYTLRQGCEWVRLGALIELEQSSIVTRVSVLCRLCIDMRRCLAERQFVQARLAETSVETASFSSEPC